MKRLFTFLVTVLSSGSLIAQIPNAGFETWTNAAGYNVPTGWDNLNAKTATTSTYTCEKGTPGNPGTSYLQLTSKAVPGMGVIPGTAVCGTIDTATYIPKPGFAYSSRPANFTGSWEYMASGADQGHVVVLLSKWNMALSKRDTISYTIYGLPGMAMSWADFSIPLTYSSGEMPDSAMILLTASRSGPVAGSYLFVDNLSFTGSVWTGVTSAANELPRLSIYPNPSTGATVVSYNSAAGGNVRLVVSDLTGREINSLKFTATAGQNRFPINVSGIAKGMYLIRIIDGYDCQPGKMVIE